MKHEVNRELKKQSGDRKKTYRPPKKGNREPVRKSKKGQALSWKKKLLSVSKNNRNI